MIYFRYWMHRAHEHDTPAHHGIRTNEFKLTFFYGLPLDATDALSEKSPAGWELYDMKRDPFEKQNLYENPEYAAVIKQLKQLLTDTKIKYGDIDSQYTELLTRLK